MQAVKVGARQLLTATKVLAAFSKGIRDCEHSFVRTDQRENGKAARSHAGVERVAGSDVSLGIRFGGGEANCGCLPHAVGCAGCVRNHSGTAKRARSRCDSKSLSRIRLSARRFHCIAAVPVEYALRDHVGYPWALTTLEAVMIVALLPIFKFGPQRKGSSFRLHTSADWNVRIGVGLNPPLPAYRLLLPALSHPPGYHGRSHSRLVSSVHRAV